MIEIKESDLVEGDFWNEGDHGSTLGLLLCMTPDGKYAEIGKNSYDEVSVFIYDHFKAYKEPEYVPWESIDEIPEEFWDGWIKYKNNEYSKIFNVDTYGKLTIYNGDKWLDLTDIFEDLTWSPTFNGEYKPCGKLKA